MRELAGIALFCAWCACSVLLGLAIPVASQWAAFAAFALATVAYMYRVALPLEDC